MTTTLIGIDPGLTGGIAILDATGDLVAVHDMPVFEVQKKTGKRVKTTRHVNSYELGDILRQAGDDAWAMLEQVGPMPSDGAMQAFRFGKSAGVLDGALGAMKLRFDLVTPQKWKKHFAITADKSQSRMLAARRWPAKADLFKRVKDEGRAEAALIALYAFETSFAGAA